jgi:pimeloyl-ACP methyl ester carboxylesterase
LELNNVVLVGASFGGWIAAEIAVKNAARLSHLVLIDSLGIKVGDRSKRDIVDMHALGREALAAHLYADPGKHRPDFAAQPLEFVEGYARDRESFAYFGWQPYMHNPKLHDRLRRIKLPTLLLWGERDLIVEPDYGRAFAKAIPNARFDIISGAGHMAHVEKPEAVVAEIAAFTNSPSTH